MLAGNTQQIAMLQTSLGSSHTAWHLAKEKTTAIMCAESVPWLCHRSLVGDALLTRKFKVLGIMSASTATEHKLNAMVVVKAGKITDPSDLEYK